MIRGQEYPSVREAARQLGVGHKVVLDALDRGDVSMVGLFRTKGKPAKILYRGVEYTSIKAAADANGVKYETFRQHREYTRVHEGPGQGRDV